MRAGTCVALCGLAVALGGWGAAAAGEVQVVKVIEDFEGPGVKDMWTRVPGAAAGKGAGMTQRVFRTWGGLAFRVDGVPEEADGVSFWVRTDDGRTASVNLWLFETRTVDGRQRQTEAWGNQFWATPTWRRLVLPIKRMRRAWAWKADGQLHRDRVTSVQFPRSIWSGSGMASARILFDHIAFVRGATEPTIERQQADWQLTVDAAKPAGTLRHFWRALSPGPSGEQNTHLQGAAGEGLRVIARDKTFDVLRVGWHVRPHKSAYVPYDYGKPVYTETDDGKPVFYFKDQDTFLDAVVKELGLRPMILMGCLPNALGSRLVYGKAMNGPPKDYKKWQAMVKGFVQHYVERYGRDEVARWYWEIWNEPDLWWHNWFWYKDGKKQSAGAEEFFKLYDHAAAGIGQALAGARIGGPAIAGYPRDYCKRLAIHAVSGANQVTGQRGAPLAFLSHHCYGSPYDQLFKLCETQGILAKHAKGRQIGVHVTEYAPSIWGEELGRRYQAASLCQAIDGYLYAADLGAPITWLYWFGLVREFDTDAAAFFAKKWKKGKYQTTTLFLCVKPPKGRGVLMAKPVYNAYRMLTYLGTARLPVSGAHFGDQVGAIATRADDGKRLAVLVYNHNARDAAAVGPAQKVRVALQGLPFGGKATLRHYAIDPDHSDVFAAWQKLGSPNQQQITPEQIQQIKTRDALEQAAPPKALTLTQGGQWTAELELPPHAVALLLIEPGS